MPKTAVATRKTSKFKSRESKTSKAFQRHTRVTIYGKDPKMDYSFRPRKDIEEGGGEDLYGYVPIDAENWNGETSSGPKSSLRNSKQFRQIRYMDTIACKRPLETKKFFDQEADERYNAHKQWSLYVSAQEAKSNLRKVDGKGEVTSDIQVTGRGFSQRPGPTMEGSELKLEE